MRSGACVLGVVCVGLAILVPAVARPDQVSRPGPPAVPPIEGRPFFWALSVNDVEVSSSWYQRILGFSELRRIDLPERGVRIRLLGTADAFLELVEQAGARSLNEVDAAIQKTYQVHGVFKLGLLVADLDTTVDRLGALGVALRGSVFTEPDESLRSAQVEDPDGNVLQLFERLDRPKLLDVKGVTTLLDVMDVLAAANPGFLEKELELGGQPEAAREAVLDAARERNESSAEVVAAIQTLLETPTYQIYFRRFTNVTGEQVRDLLLDLPYRQRRAPGDIGVTLYELLRNRDLVRTAVDRLVDEADMEWVYETALRFAPGWEGEPPTMHLIYDSNAGSFASEGVPFFNVFTGIDLASLSEATDASALREAEETMAHELQHVLAEPTLYPESAEDLTWQKSWIDRLTRGLVGEGVANLCSPPSGRIKEVYEDPGILARLVERYSELLQALLADEITEEETRSWYRDNYSEVAIGLLRKHLSTRYQGDELDRMVESSMPYRPDVEHALGWWMVSRIWERDPRPEAVAGLLEDPFSVYRLYNETLEEEQNALRLAPDLVGALSRD